MTFRVPSSYCPRNKRVKGNSIGPCLLVVVVVWTVSLLVKFLRGRFVRVCLESGSESPGTRGFDKEIPWIRIGFQFTKNSPMRKRKASIVGQTGILSTAVQGGFGSWPQDECS